MEAAHVKPFVYGGRGDASNVVILCRRHHSELGDVLTVNRLTEALRNGVAATVSFSLGNGEPCGVEGHVARVAVPGDTSVGIYFTREHAEFWLEENREVTFVSGVSSLPVNAAEAPMLNGGDA